MAFPAKKVRKANFSPAEISDLKEKFDENMDILQSKCTNTMTNVKKNKIWEEITEPSTRRRLRFRRSYTLFITDKIIWKLNLEHSDKFETEF